MSETEVESRNHLMTMASQIVQAYVAKNHIQQSDLPGLLSAVHETLISVTTGNEAAEQRVENRPSAADVRKSINKDYLVSFEDGKRYKTLKRHLTRLGLTSEQYRHKWGLPMDYPMVSKGYSERRSELARAAGLGQQRRKTAAAS
jgi:predicted transcriptional regulator